MTEKVLIKGAYLWDGVHDNLIPDGAVLIEGERIKEVGKIRELDQLDHNEVLNWPDCTLMPGLIDCHTHLSMDPTLENYLDHMSDPVTVLTLRAIAMMRKDLKAGVTTCRCLGDKEYLDIACRHAVENGTVDGPRLLVAGHGIRAPHGHGFVGYPTDGVERIRETIRQNSAAGTDLTKIYITGTLKGDSLLPSYLTREEIRVAINESHDAGLPVAAHCVGGEGLDWALELGLDTLEHAYHISDDQIGRLAESDTWLVLTPGPILSEERVHHLPGNLIPGHLEEKDQIAGRMSAIIEAGFAFGVGTDGMHGELAQEIAYLVELGATHLKALQAATVNGARVCGLEKETGSLEPGKYADIITVKGNPLADIRVLKNIIAVMKHGKVAEC